MVKNSRERVTSSTPTLQKEEEPKKTAVKCLSGNARLPIWPEWDDASLANEKWDVQQKGKSDRAARTPGTLFEDTEGLLQLPASLKVETWRRPADYLGDKAFQKPSASGMFQNSPKGPRMSTVTLSSNMLPPPGGTGHSKSTHHPKQAQTVVEDPEQTGRLNILLPNQHLFKQSEVIRAIITQISLLYQTEIPSPPGLRTDGNGGTGDVWKPWHHLYPRSKPPNSFPVHSPSGKYAVKLFWMGCWRKIIVDDQIPFDVDGKPLLPQCANDTELWLPVLSKAIMKVASLDYDSGYPDKELNETSVIHMLTGWLPEVIDVKSSTDEEIWNMINSNIPKWTEEAPPPENASVHSAEQSLASQSPGGCPTNKEPALLFGSYDIKFNGDEPIGVPEIKSEVGGTSFTGSPPPMIWLTETRNTAIPPPKPAPFQVAEPGAALKPTEALFQLRQQRQQRIKHELLLKQLAATSPRLIHATSAFANFEEVLGDYVPDMTPFTGLKCGFKKKEGEKKDPKKKDSSKPKKDGADKDKGDKKKDDKKKSTDEKSEKADKKKDKNKKTPEVQPEPAAEPDTPVEDVEEEEESVPVSPLLSFWVEFGQFFTAFSKLYVFHKPADYTCHRSVSDMRNISPSSMVTQTGGRRTAAGQSVSSATHLRGIPAPSPLPTSGTVPQHQHSHLQGQPGEEQPPLIICIDSTSSIEMLVSLTSLSLWHGAPLIHTPTLGPICTSGNKLGYTPTEVVEHNAKPDNTHQIIVPGRLELSNFLWSDIRANIDTLISVGTSGTSCHRITLPPGLHTLRLSVAAPYAWHADFISNTPFVIADTESFVNHVNKESLRYQAAALYLVKLVGDNLSNFDEPEKVSRTIEEIACADKGREADKVFPNLKVFLESLFYMLDTTIGDSITTKHKEAWSAFSTMIVRAYKKGMGDSLLGIFENDPVPFRKYTDDEVLENAAEKKPKVEVNENDEAAAKTIQKHFRGHHVRKRTKVLQKGNKINLSVKGLLQESWGKLEGDELQHGLTILNRIIATEPSVLTQYSFNEDKKRCAYYIDYHGSHGEVPVRNWFLMFKEVFTAPVATLVKVSVSASIPGLRVRIINNDTGKEMPKIGQKPKPCVFEPNKAGYTMVCEGKTYDGPLSAGKYRIRLVGSTPDLLLPARDISTTGIIANEVKEYHVPDKHSIMFRYVVNVTTDTQTTVQVSTSKSDVNFRLEVFDGEETLSTQEGIGHIVLPNITFYCDDSDKIGSAKGRRTPVKSRRVAGVKSGTKSPGRSKISPVVPEQPDCVTPRKKSHQYIIQGTVLRNTWDNNLSPWQRIIDEVLPKDDQDRPMSGSVTEEKPSTPNKKRSVKEEKSDPKKAAKAGGKAMSPAFDESKPYWVLRVCSDSGADEVILRRDTQRQDEIKSIKAAWEELQPGRAAKAKALRQKYLDKRAADVAKLAEENQTDDPSVTQEASDQVPELAQVEQSSRVPSVIGPCVSEVIRPDSPKFYEIPEMYKSFVKECQTEPELFDDAEHARFLETHKTKVDNYHEERRLVLAARDEDRARRNELKEELLSTAENMQVEVDATREDVCALRESLRQRMIAEEQARLAALEPAEAQSSPSPKPTSAKKPKSPKGAKKKK